MSFVNRVEGIVPLIDDSDIQRAAVIIAANSAESSECQELLDILGINIKDVWPRRDYESHSSGADKSIVK